MFVLICCLKTEQYNVQLCVSARSSSPKKKGAYISSMQAIYNQQRLGIYFKVRGAKEDVRLRCIKRV